MATTSDLGLLGRKLGAADYDPDMYVKEIAQRCVGGHELHQQRVNIQVSEYYIHTSELSQSPSLTKLLERLKQVSLSSSNEYYLCFSDPL